MKVTIEPTEQFVAVDGMPARIWQGTSEGGVAVTCLVVRVAVQREVDQAQFEHELLETRPVAASPAALGAFPLNIVI